MRSWEEHEGREKGGKNKGKSGEEKGGGRGYVIREEEAEKAGGMELGWKRWRRERNFVRKEMK